MFEDWWKIYPRRVGKLKAAQVYKTQIRKGHTDAELLVGLKCSIADWNNRNISLEYIPHPATYLRQGRWLDDNRIEPIPRTDDTGRACCAPESGYGSLIHKRIGAAFFQAYFGGCEFTETTIIAPSQARADYIINKFRHRLPDLIVEVRK